jgi:hypothetical protein
MYSVIIKSAVLLSIFALLPLASASADRKKEPLVLMDGGTLEFPPNDPNPTSATLTGSGVATHLGKIVSGGQFNNVGNLRSGCCKGEINGTATDPSGDTLEYFLSAQFCPAPASGVFNAIGVYRITGGTGKFAQARGFGQFIGLAYFGTPTDPPTYQCFLRGTISY